MFESPGLTPHANGSSSFQPEVSWEHLEVFDFSPSGISYDSLVEAKNRRIGESNLGDVRLSLGDGVVTQDAVADAQAEVLDVDSDDNGDKDEDDGIYLNVDEQIVSREIVGGKVT
ncbi:hypothetical protein RHMOL_Rhmol04G0193600 [Rhododendron molle]|uniref:Uncharacterized protein n=1 Tax=Rhododendron molle TaxID=49168 RepID=A0ACC0P2G9_RHOML|nr:hypothetical protein RHMOL_Rhmol04G0193600 [Rhododendron molle]